MVPFSVATALAVAIATLSRNVLALCSGLSNRCALDWPWVDVFSRRDAQKSPH
jgi:hypothetical protein